MKVSKYLRGLVLLLALSVLTNGQKQCPPGQAADPQGNCIDVNFIEGCAVYSSKQQCSQCEFSTAAVLYRLCPVGWNMRLQTERSSKMLFGFWSKRRVLTMPDWIISRCWSL